MSLQRRIFPSDEPSFVNSAKTLFSLPVDTLERLMKGLESRKTLFSTAYVADTLQRGVGLAQNVRMTLLFILHQVDEADGGKKDFAKEFIDMGCEKEKVDIFASIILKTTKDTFRAATTLFQVESYLGGTDHLHGFGAHINFTNLGRVGKPLVMFPLVRMTIVVQGEEESRETSFDMDANRLQVFIMEMQEILKGMLAESALLKKALGNNFSSLIGD